MSDTQRWTIDGIAEGIARIELEDEGTLSLPRWLLPAAARDGLVLRVTRTPRGRDAVAITIAIDREATAEATDASAKQVAELRDESRKRDPGGDVAL